MLIVSIPKFNHPFSALVFHLMMVSLHLELKLLSATPANFLQILSLIRSTHVRFIILLPLLELILVRGEIPFPQNWMEQ